LTREIGGATGRYVPQSGIDEIRDDALDLQRVAIRNGAAAVAIAELDAGLRGDSARPATTEATRATIPSTAIVCHKRSYQTRPRYEHAER